MRFSAVGNISTEQLFAHVSDTLRSSSIPFIVEAERDGEFIVSIQSKEGLVFDVLREKLGKKGIIVTLTT